ncbi:MAG: alkylated DNA repair dioxygenase AlkB [Glaciecola sp.]|jgi:alkylated DNA repair dioxygenase AlkB
MNLFELEPNSEKNLLPKDGTASYYGKLFSKKEADSFYESLFTTIKWEHDKIFIFGKQTKTDRKVAWYGEKKHEYTYSKITKTALTWTKKLLELKSKVERVTGESFNSCLVNLYHNGSEGMGWHSDDEKSLANNGAIASLSFGSERKFSFKHKESKSKIELVLEHGSLLLMKDETQRYWLHQLPKTKKIEKPRINLTFRKIAE